MMYPAIFARTYPITCTAEVIAAASGDGFSGVQFNLMCAGLSSLPPILPDGLAEEVGRVARSACLKIAALSGSYNMAHPDTVVRMSERKGFANVVEAARRMGAPVVTLCSGTRNTEDMWKPHIDNTSVDAWRDFLTELENALEVAEKAGIKLAVEPEPGNVVQDAAAARRLLDEVASPHLGIVLDVANLLSPGTLPRQHAVVAHAVELLGDNILLAHAKDIDREGHVVAAGEGYIDLKSFVAALFSSGYDGALVGHGFAPDKARHVASLLTHLIDAPS